MPTHDYNIANDSGANVRTDLNNALAAIVQYNSNAGVPGTTFAHMIFADTTPAGYTIYTVRNAADSTSSTLFDDEGRWKGIDGTVGEPSISFGSDIDTGFYRIGVNNPGLSLNGVKSWDYTAATTVFEHSASVALRVRSTGASSVAFQLANSVADWGINCEAGGNWNLEDVNSGTFPFRVAKTTGDMTYTGAEIHTPVTITTDTTPTAVGRRNIIIGAWTAANDITDFDNETAGQRLTIHGGDTDCNIVDGAGLIELVGGATWNAAAGASIDLLSIGGAWHEQYRSAT